MIRSAALVLLGATVSLLSPAYAEDTGNDGESTYEERNRAANPNMGDCDMPNQIKGATLIRYGASVRLGWWSLCDEGVFFSVPIDPDIGHQPHIFPTVDDSLAYLTCNRMSDELVFEGGVARYACASTRMSMPIPGVGLTYYSVLQEGRPV